MIRRTGHVLLFFLTGLLVMALIIPWVVGAGIFGILRYIITGRGDCEAAIFYPIDRWLDGMES